MNTSEIKNFLHQMVVETEDFEILEKVKAYFNNLRSKKGDWWTELSEEEKQSTEKAIQQIEKGEFHTHKEVRKEIDELLKNKK